MKKLIIVIVIIMGMVLACGAIGLIVINFMPARVVGPMIGQITTSNFSVEATEEYDYPTAGSATIDVQTLFGNIDVTGSQDNKVHITAHKTAWGVNQAAAEQTLKDTNVIIKQDKDNFTIRVEQKTPTNVLNNSNASSVDFTIQVPTTTTVVAKSNSGKVELAGTQGKADLDSEFGDVSITNLLGGLSARSKSGRVTARQIGTLPSGDGDVNLQSDFGDINLEDIKVIHVIGHSGSGSVTANNTISSNEVDLSSDFGSVTYKVGQAASLKVNTKSGAVNLTDLVITRDVTAHSDFGSLNLTHVTGGSYDLSSDNGSINSDMAQGSFKAISKFGGIDISGGNQANVDLETSSGRVNYRGSLGNGSHIFKSEFGDIQISLPQDSTFTFDLQTEFGKIRSDFKVSIEGEPNEDHWKGSVGKGGSSINAVTKNGTVSLESYLP